jgi:SNF2 family DNA or RNA helicase
MIKYTPWEYQEKITQFIIDNPKCAIFADMGLGKTVSCYDAVSKLYSSGKLGKVLIIAPVRVASHTWPEERKKWDFSGWLDLDAIEGIPKKRLECLKSEAHIHTVSRDNVVWLTNQYVMKDSRKLRKKNPWPYDMIIIDESTSFKNRTSQRFKKLRKLTCHTERVVLLSGTPTGNGLESLWAQIYLLDQGERLGRTFTEHEEKFFRRSYNGFSLEPLEDSEEKIFDLISDISLSMKSEDYLKLPPLIINDIELTFDKKLRAVYDKLEKEFVITLDEEDELKFIKVKLKTALKNTNKKTQPERYAKIEEKIEEYSEQIQIVAKTRAALSMKLRQLCGGAPYKDIEEGKARQWVDIHSLKLDALEEIIDSAQGVPILVAYQFESDKQRILKRFRNAKALGKTSDIDKWNAGKFPIFLVHERSVGHGMNMQHGGNRLVWFNITWSFECYEQLLKRLHRQGQTRPVFVDRILIKDTVDSDMCESLREDKGLLGRLMDRLKKNCSKRQRLAK